jgi:hypothetical protein
VLLERDLSVPVIRGQQTSGGELAAELEREREGDQALAELARFEPRLGDALEVPNLGVAEIGQPAGVRSFVTTWRPSTPVPPVTRMFI